MARLSDEIEVGSVVLWVVDGVYVSEGAGVVLIDDDSFCTSSTVSLEDVPASENVDVVLEVDVVSFCMSSKASLVKVSLETILTDVTVLVVDISFCASKVTLLNVSSESTDTVEEVFPDVMLGIGPPVVAL